MDDRNPQSGTKDAALDDERTATERDHAPVRTPVERGGALPPVEASDDAVDDASEESFPASDPPAYSRIT